MFSASVIQQLNYLIGNYHCMKLGLCPMAKEKTNGIETNINDKKNTSDESKLEIVLL